MNSTLSKRFSYVLVGGGIVLSALAVLLLIATYQHNAAVAAEVEAAQEAITHSAEMTNGSDENAAERAQELAEIEALAEESRGSYMPSAILLLLGVGGLMAGVRIYRSNGSAGEGG